MADEALPLNDEERAELEALRAEKLAREQREQAARERAELEALRAERAQAPQTTPAPAPTAAPRTKRVPDAEDLRIAEARKRGAQLMEPDDDLNMPTGQKIVLGVLALLVVIIVAMTFLTGGH